MIREGFRNTPVIELMTNQTEDDCDSEMIYIPNGDRIQIPLYYRDEDDFIDEFIDVINAWSFVGYLDDDFVEEHIDNIIIMFNKVFNKDTVRKR